MDSKTAGNIRTVLGSIPIIGTAIGNLIPENKVLSKKVNIGQGDPTAGYSDQQLTKDYNVESSYGQGPKSLFSKIYDPINQVKDALTPMVLNAVAPGAGTALSSIGGAIDSSIKPKEEVPNMQSAGSLLDSPPNLQSTAPKLSFGSGNPLAVKMQGDRSVTQGQNAIDEFMKNSSLLNVPVQKF